LELPARILILLLGQPAGQYRKPSKQARPSVVQLV
jgi:hypothetical protein